MHKTLTVTVSICCDVDRFGQAVIPPVVMEAIGALEAAVLPRWPEAVRIEVGEAEGLPPLRRARIRPSRAVPNGATPHEDTSEASAITEEVRAELEAGAA